MVIRPSEHPLCYAGPKPLAALTFDQSDPHMHPHLGRQWHTGEVSKGTSYWVRIRKSAEPQAYRNATRTENS